MNNKTISDQSYYDSLFKKENPEGDELFIRSGKQKNSQWMITWSDLMMTMFIVFLVMYLYQLADNRSLKQEKAVSLENSTYQFRNNFSSSIGNPEIDDKRDISFTLTADSKSDIKSVDLVSDRIIRIVLPGDIFFDSGTTELKKGNRNALRKAAEIIRQTPYMVNVVGHTDNQPIVSEQFKSNWELSVIRACTVTQFLINDMNIPENRFYVTGHSSNLPVKSNSTRTNMIENRRVEIIITRELPRKRNWRPGIFGQEISMNLKP